MDPSLSELLFASANASVHFASTCLEPVDAQAAPGPATARLRARSSFVNVAGREMHWHAFGDLEGPGWAASAIGGANLLYRWGRYIEDDVLCQRAMGLANHILMDGFIREDGFIWPYWDLAHRRFCLNYTHTNKWLCPGSLARIGVEMLDLAQGLDADTRHAWTAMELRRAANGLGSWLTAHVRWLPNGWVPRRVTATGGPYPYTPEGGLDPIFDHSADGLFLLALLTRLGYIELAQQLGDAFIAAGGFWGSLNHDTYDDHENVAYAVAFRVLRGCADALSRPEWRRFAYQVALPAMQHFRIGRDEHGVVTQGLFWMEESWDTAYLWENAEVAQAHLEAWIERGTTGARDVGLQILEAIAHHHYGPEGFLTEGVDWNNHVGQRHHVGFSYYGAIRYTEPLLNNLYLVGPTLTYLETVGSRPPSDVSWRNSLHCLAKLSPLAQGVRELARRDMRYLLRLFYPLLADDASVDAVLAFVKRAGIDGVLLFESSYDVDPALLSLDVLESRFARLKALVPRFRALGLEVHINIMVTMGHVDHGGGHPEDFNFQFLVGSEGYTSRSTPCPLDPNFQDYVAQIYRWAAECGADAVWVDDDVRFLGHDVLGMTCFCPLHLAAMEGRTGRSWTREELVAALADDGADSQVRQAWFDLQASAIEALAARIEQSVHSVDPRQAIGLMSVGTMVHSAEGRYTDRLLRTLAGSEVPPMLRPGAGFWHDWEPGAVLVKTEDVARQTAYLGADVRVVAEIENHPYSPYQKSRRILALEMALNILAGVHDISLNLFSGTMSFRDDEMGYAEFLREQRAFLQALRHARAGKRRLGVGVEAREDVARSMRLRGRSLEDWVIPRPWEIALARLGIPVGLPYDRPHLLSGDVVYTDAYALGSVLQDGAVLTPLAVQGLLLQGWGERLGIRSIQPAAKDVNELLTMDVLNGGHGGDCLPVRHYYEVLAPHTFEFTDAVVVRPLSRWQGLGGRPGGVATAALSLPDGTRLGLLPFEVTQVTPALLHTARRDQWSALLAWVARTSLPVRVVEGVNVMPQLFVSSDGAAVLLALVNLSADDAMVELDAPALNHLACSERLTPNGAWVSWKQGTSIEVAAWSITALRFRDAR